MGCLELFLNSCAETSVPIDLRRVSQWISGVAQRKLSQLFCMTGNGAFLWSQCKGIGRHFNLIWAIPSYFNSCGDISVLLDLWGISGWLSVVPSSKSRLLTCLIVNKTLLCTQCRGIGPHLSARCKFHGFSQVAAGTWSIFLSYGRNRN